LNYVSNPLKVKIQWLHKNCKKYKKVKRILFVENPILKINLFEVGRETLALIKTINNVATYFLRSNSFPFTCTEH